MAFKNDQVNEKETERIVEIAKSCLNTPGDFVEFGCYKGDTSLLLAEVVFSGPRLWIYDSFEGLPEKTAEDASVMGENFKAGELFVTKREVKERFLRAGLKVPVIKKAWFKDLTVADLPEKISFALLDGDFYESIRDSLRLIEDKIVRGGVIIIHDYKNPELPGVEKAVNEWNQKKGFKIEVYQSMAVIKL